jgi:integrase
MSGDRQVEGERASDVEFDARPYRWAANRPVRLPTHLALVGELCPRVVQEHLGHAHISITLQTYSHVQTTMHDDAAALVANLVLPEG